MNCLTSTYYRTYSNAICCGFFASSASTGKERDEETGYGYFGARYMDHELMTMWLSVDPMADKYPNMSPYAYCAWNPVKMVDPNGRDWYQNIYSGAVYYNSDMHGAECAGMGAMKGEGWVFLGQNSMFMKNQHDLANTDYRLALTNGGLTNTIPNNPYDVLDQSTHIQVTLSWLMPVRSWNERTWIL